MPPKSKPPPGGEPGSDFYGYGFDDDRRIFTVAEKQRRLEDLRLETVGAGRTYKAEELVCYPGDFLLPPAVMSDPEGPMKALGGLSVRPN